MDHAGINRCTAKTDQNDSGHCRFFAKRNNYQRYSDCNYNLAKTYHIFIAEFICHKTAYSPADGYSGIKQGCKARGGFFGNSVFHNKITACPKTGGTFQSTIAEKSRHNFLCSGNCKNFFYGKGFCFYGIFRVCFLFFPKRKSKKKNGGKNDLQNCDRAVTKVPASFCHCRRKKIGSR